MGRGTVWQHEEQNVRVVDENVKLAAGDLGNLLVAGLDALGVGDVEGEGAHAHVGHLGQDGWVTGRCDDMDAFMVRLLVFCLVKFELKAMGGKVCSSGNGQLPVHTLLVKLEAEGMTDTAWRAAVIRYISNLISGIH